MSISLKDIVASLSHTLKYEWHKQLGKWPLSQILYVKYWGKPDKPKTVVITNRPF